MSHIAIDINHQQLTATVDHPLIARSVGETTFAVTADETATQLPSYLPQHTCKSPAYIQAARW